MGPHLYHWTRETPAHRLKTGFPPVREYSTHGKGVQTKLGCITTTTSIKYILDRQGRQALLTRGWSQRRGVSGAELQESHWGLVDPDTNWGPCFTEDLGLTLHSDGGFFSLLRQSSCQRWLVPYPSSSSPSAGSSPPVASWPTTTAIYPRRLHRERGGEHKQITQMSESRPSTTSDVRGPQRGPQRSPVLTGVRELLLFGYEDGVARVRLGRVVAVVLVHVGPLDGHVHPWGGSLLLLLGSVGLGRGDGVGLPCFELFGGLQCKGWGWISWGVGLFHRA